MQSSSTACGAMFVVSITESLTSFLYILISSDTSKRYGTLISSILPLNELKSGSCKKASRCFSFVVAKKVTSRSGLLDGRLIDPFSIVARRYLKASTGL